ncbi:gluconokinase [Pseudorhodobacter turbinis]|uniref:Gluconokinase n=1 Tax=Pseudorhodobacter turbinis TaxID=2500533 RepID=A0A4P8EFJ1_9RHOB|nr:gluconokinase [Pseudorhodobacter turbinis]QCO55636.1 gluconokinase [Pseudorhodobacter turbinis]
MTTSASELAQGRYVLMGVAGCGKSSVGVALAKAIGTKYLDGDDLHPATNIAKMGRGEALTDADRWPWLAKVGTALANPGILGCSALRKSYRNRIAEHAGGPVCFIYLAGSPEVIATRMAARSGHFMPPSLLESQFATLEPPTAEEPAIKVGIDQPIPLIIAEIIEKLRG